METQNSDVTWEDVQAVCKLIGKDKLCLQCLDDDRYVVHKLWGISTVFTDPTAALEFISAEEHPLEQKYANILRTKPQP